MRLNDHFLTFNALSKLRFGAKIASMVFRIENYAKNIITNFGINHAVIFTLKCLCPN